jgi:uncharacterized RDD family membrane protein YckC
VTRAANDPATVGLLQHRAGLVSRGLANALDLVAVVAIGFAAQLVLSAVVGLFTRGFEVLTPPQPWRGVLAALLVVVYLGYGWGLGGRTFGKTVMGLRVVGEDGEDIPTRRGMLRAVNYLVFPPGLLWAAVSRRNASLQDLLVRTAVVHDWGFATPHPHAPPAREAGGG